MKTLSGLVIGAFALTSVTAVTPALADSHGHKHKNLMMQIEKIVKNKQHAKLIHDRRKEMRALGGNMKKIVDYLKHGKGGPNAVAAAAGAIEVIASKTHSLFPAGTGMDNYAGITGAKTSIQSDNAGFKAAADELATLAAQLKKVASSSGANKGQIAAAFRSVGRMGCGGCHRTYRQKLKR